MTNLLLLQHMSSTTITHSTLQLIKLNFKRLWNNNQNILFWESFNFFIHFSEVFFKFVWIKEVHFSRMNGLDRTSSNISYNCLTIGTLQTILKSVNNPVKSLNILKLTFVRIFQILSIFQKCFSKRVDKDVRFSCMNSLKFNII